MNCRFCGAPLPPGAMFCGACGRSTTSTAGIPVVAASAAAHCAQCGAVLRAGDVFCPECGFVVAHPRPAPPQPAPTPPTPPSLVRTERRADTVALTAEEVQRFHDEAAAVWAATPSLGLAPEPPVVAAEPSAAAAAPEQQIDAVVTPEPEELAEPESQPEPEPEFEATVVAEPEPHLERRSMVTAPRPAAVPTPSTARFVLHFSTGETITVAGTGLVGRNPSPQPSERFDHLVVVADAGKSVSKTHLEFGQDDGVFWVSDRYSTNGSVVRTSDNAPEPCVAGRRYHVPRGTRVDIGDQFFVVF